MKHTECKDCKFREGDCGYHHRFNGEVNYDIPSLSSCDKYGNCGHFQQKETPNEWQTEIVEIRKYYAKCPYCEFSFEMKTGRELPYFCGACGRRLRGKEE